jgi:hypothetical protein
VGTPKLVRHLNDIGEVSQKFVEAGTLGISSVPAAQNIALKLMNSGEIGCGHSF